MAWGWGWGGTAAVSSVAHPFFSLSFFSLLACRPNVPSVRTPALVPRQQVHSGHSHAVTRSRGHAPCHVQPWRNVRHIPSREEKGCTIKGAPHVHPMARSTSCPLSPPLQRSILAADACPGLSRTLAMGRHARDVCRTGHGGARTSGLRLVRWMGRGGAGAARVHGGGDLGKRAEELVEERCLLLCMLRAATGLAPPRRLSHRAWWCTSGPDCGWSDG